MKTGITSRAYPALVAVLFLVAGCSSTPVRLPPVSEQGSDVPVTDEPVRQPVDGRGGMPAASGTVQQPSPAVVALLESAETQANQGRLESSAASLERALRIEPGNPVLWYHLATVRLSQGDPAQAEQLAVKSNRLAVGNRTQQSRNWSLIARARELRNDREGAEQARSRARALAR